MHCFVIKSVNFVKCPIISVYFISVAFSCKTCNLPHPMSSMLLRSEVFTKRYFSMGMLLRCAVGSEENTYGDLQFQCYCLLAFTEVARWCGCFSADVLCTFQASFRLLYWGECFCDITCHYCFFCVYFFNVGHVF